MAHSAFSQKPTASRVLVDANWAIKQSKSCSKKNKTDLKKIKEHIATLKRDGTHGLGQSQIPEEPTRDDQEESKQETDNEETKESLPEASQEASQELSLELDDGPAKPDSAAQEQAMEPLEQPPLVQQRSRVETFMSQLQTIQTRFLPHHVYLHQCSNCTKFGQALHMRNCFFCEYQNPFYDANVPVDDTVASDFIQALMELYPRLNQQNYGAQNEPMSSFQEGDAAEDCLRWRCWRCSNVWRADQSCPKCQVGIADYEGHDLEQILVQAGQAVQAETPDLNMRESFNAETVPKLSEHHVQMEVAGGSDQNLGGGSLGLTESEIFEQARVDHTQQTAQIKKESHVEVEAQDPNQWDCQACTYTNTVKDWIDVDESSCELCLTKNESIEAVILANKADEQQQQQESQKDETQEQAFLAWANKKSSEAPAAKVKSPQPQTAPQFEAPREKRFCKECLREITCKGNMCSRCKNKRKK